MLEHGSRTAFGPREEVLKSRVRNHADIARHPQARSVT